jgi:hypothetical protein
MKMCVTIYEIINENYAPFLYDALIDAIRDHDHDARNRSNYLLPYPGVKYVKINFLYLGINLWNNLENVFKDVNTSKKLKIMLKNKFLDSY